MDKSRIAWVHELIRLVYALAVIKYYNGWFTLDNYIPHGSTILLAYLVFSLIVSLAFEFLEFKTDSKLDEAMAKARVANK
jgi:hypothetical protein